MKRIVLTVLSAAVLLIGHMTRAEPAPCLKEAKFQARTFAAKENQVPVRSILVKDWAYHGEKSGVLYYGFLLDNREQVNVGLTRAECRLSEVYYATDGL